ncbi:class I SAM-dependent methyltransferase [Streptomyces sp. NBC_01762]|uniref:class I SAM-dependent methyltransferase n=1 Tax=unclassified Streptomyces TaxID=2593676 RepID=UPI002DD9B912|nr:MULTISPECIES: class I SAM-dependent methyltransferase [unclassified Streptomyces]WSC49581.1 class I SAM-dependent methyltransferase [Streptomyces sp. NBC_01762]WSD29155.1 class I SAM-dependent methyltransferase [Streptomyces sp. NBC_01751]
MAPQDAILGWDEDTNAEAYNAFTRAHPMYDATSRDLARRGQLANASLVVDLCGGAGATARAILDLIPARARVVSVDNAAAMQRVGRRTLTDARLAWITSPAEQLADHLHADSADAVVCNSAIWKTDTAAVFTAVAHILRPGGHFVFNIGGGFAGVRHPDEQSVRTGPSLNALIRQVVADDHGYTPPTAADAPPKLPLETVAEQLTAAGLNVLDTDVTAQHSTMAEKKAWLSIPVFARPEGDFTHAQRMQILHTAYAMTTPDAPTVTSWLVVVAQRPEATA